MKVYYHSVLNDLELTPGEVFRVVPCKASLELSKEKTDGSCEILYDGTIISSDVETIECNEEAELIVRNNGERSVYAVRPLVQPLSGKYAKAYEQFSFEYQDVESDEINSILSGSLKMYAVDQSTEIRDYTDVFNQIEEGFNAFKTICERPKTHLKAVNEVRPIETVKRIGYESIPYLAAHSEDWLARTASGLKPARLFSRVEEDEYQIYENRVVKTLIDLILTFLRRTEKQLRDQRDQLRGIINNSVKTDSFGFDVSFRKAISELMPSDEKSNEYRSKNLEKAEKLQRKAYYLLKRYRMLRQTRLYRYLKKAKPVQNPLNETNILVMDKHYSVIFKLWKTVHHVIAPKTEEDESPVAFDDTCDDYQRYCATLCGYAAHILGFDLLEEGCYERCADHISLTISCSENGLIKVVLKDTERRNMAVPPEIDIPVFAGMTDHRITYDGHSLSWPNDITADEMEAFCSLHKNKGKGREQNTKKKYTDLKVWLDKTERSFPRPEESSFLIIPLAVELGTENGSSFRTSMEAVARRYLAENPGTEIIAALPVCNETEQRITEYAKEEGQLLSILPLTMFDINSFRRLQNVLYRKILNLKKESCPNCGGKLRRNKNQLICDNEDCRNLTLTKTICANPDCKHEYLYMGYDVSDATLEKMRKVQRDSFFEWDSLYQYKNVVNMTVTSGKIRTVCPRCHMS